MKNKDFRKLLMVLACIVVVSMAMVSHHADHTRQSLALGKMNQAWRTDTAHKKQTKKVAKKAAKASKDTTNYTITGLLTDEQGHGMEGVVVSDGYTCVLTDTAGYYTLLRNKQARFVYYSVPAYCEVPVHADNDRTAYFYQPVEANKKVYDFKLKRLPEGKERRYKMIVIGDPQVTNAINPYYTSPDDNPVKKSDIERFTAQTMKDIRKTIQAMPNGTAVYGLSMGDDVQYYGGYNPRLEREIRRALGSSQMRLFSVIGNHDQDGNALYKRKWEDSWGPTDYSFNRGDEHYVCINNVQFTRHKSYYSPGELTAAQVKWLEQDLALTPRSMKVVLCYHIPFTFGNSPYGKAHPLDIAKEKGHYISSRLSMLLGLLERFEGGYELFCGHTHFALNHEINYQGRHIMEHCHAAACGNIWQSNINICGTPNGYYVYTFEDTRLTDCYYKGTFWNASRQMTLFRADTDFNGDSYVNDWNLPKNRGVLVANVFNADSRWRVIAIEDGEEHHMKRIASKGQDAFAAGYHHKYAKCAPYSFVSKANGYLIMNHLYYYEPKNPKANIIVEATDPYGHVFTATSGEVVTNAFYNYAHYYANERK